MPLKNSYPELSLGPRSSYYIMGQVPQNLECLRWY